MPPPRPPSRRRRPRLARLRFPALARCRARRTDTERRGPRWQFAGPCAGARSNISRGSTRPGPAHGTYVSLAERRQRKREDVQPIVEILAKRPASTARPMFLLVAAIRRTSALSMFGASEPLEFAELEHAEVFHLGRQGKLADLVEKQGPPLRQVQSSLSSGLTAPVNAPASSSPNSSDSNNVSRKGRTVDLDERLACPFRVRVNGLCHELLSGARLSEDQRGGDRARHLADLLVEPGASRRSSRSCSRIRTPPYRSPRILTGPPRRGGLDLRGGQPRDLPSKEGSPHEDP